MAARNKWARIEALEDRAPFLDAYLDARRRWLAGRPTLFPAGTYWLRVHAYVPVVRHIRDPVA